MIYGAKELVDSFNTVRKNTIAVAEDIPAEQYGYKATADVKSVGEMLAHIAVSPDWQIALHGAGITATTFAMFQTRMAAAATEEQTLGTKDQIVAALKERGERFTAFVAGLDSATLAQTVSFPPPIQPAQKTRFEMLMSVKEHEMHHRAQLMLIERLLGIVPHGTRQRQAAAAVRA
ncbi:MAG: DinB family protein [Acidobacteriota bacterium]